MSTVSQVRPSPVSKYETFVEEQLARARNRIRLLDLAAAGLGFLIVTLGYGLLMAVLDRLLELSSLVRQAAFGLYLVGAVVYLGFVVSRVLLRRVNPLYAAKQVEQSLPGAKNSVVNYLDLRDQDLPAPIRGAVSHRAAKDLARADLDQAISTRRTGWLGGILGGLFLGLVVLFFLGPPQFFSLLRRAFAPFTETTIATRTQINIMQPEGGNCTVSVGRAVPILASVFGHIPESNSADALRLLYRRQPNDPYTERPLERGDSRNEWGTLVPAAEVQNGFWYKVAGGDTETPEYRVQVRSNPLVESVEVRYHFRPYLNRPDQTTNDPNLEALRGTEVTLTARTNREIREGHVEFVGEGKSLNAEKVAEEPRALRVKFPLDKDGSYRIWFTSQEGERNAEPMPYTIHAKKDNPPRVEVTKLDPAPARPAAAGDKAAEKDGDMVIELPANGLLAVEGVARDDYGVVGMKLRAEGDVQLARTYREGKSFKLDNGNFPLKLDYKDFVDLGQVKLANGQPLRAGVEFECWLEATDNCDYPEANVGRSERFKVRIKDAEKNPQKQQQQRQKAQEEQKKHNERQDQNLKKEGQEQPQQPKDDQPKDNPQNREEKKDNPGNEGAKQPKPDQGNEPKNGDEPKDGEKQPQDGAGKQEKPDQPPEKSGNGQENTEQRVKDQANRLEEALRDGERNQNNKGQQGTDGQKPDSENQPGQQGNDGQKPGADSKPGQQGDSGQKPDNESKSGPQGQAGQKPGAANNPNPQGSDGQKPGAENQPGQKPNDAQKPGADNKQQDNGRQPNAENQPGQQGNDGQKPNADTQNHQQDANGQKPGADKKDGQQGKNNQKPGAENNAAQQGNSGQKPDANNKPNEQGNAGQKPDAANKPNQQGNDGQKPGADQKNGQQGNDGQKPNTDNKLDRQGRDGQKPGADKKDGQQGADGQKPNADNKPDQQGNAGRKPNADSKSSPKGADSQKPGAENSSGQKDNKGSNADNKPSQQGNDGQKPGADKKQSQQGNSGQKPGADQKPAPQGNDGPKPGADKKDGQQGADGRKPDAAKKPDQQSNAGQKSGSDQKPDQQGASGQKPGSEKKPDQQGNAGQKPDTAKSGQPKNSEGNKGENDRKPSIDELIKALKNGDAKVREDALKKLEDAKETVKDPALRKAIEDACKECKGGQSGEKSGQPGQKSASGNGQGQSASGQGDGSKAGQPQPNAQENSPKNKDGQPNGQETKGGPKNGQESKDGQPNGQGSKNGEKNGQEGKGTQPQGQSDKGSQGKDGEGSQGQGNQGQPDAKPGDAGSRPGGGSRANRTGPTGGASEPDPKGSEANPLYQQKAGELQLENFKKKVTKDVLKKANMTEEEYQKFLRAYEEMLKRKRSEPAAKDEKLADPKNRGGNLNNIGARRFDPKGKDDKVQRSGAALPPPEYREAYKEFTEKLSGLERSGDKK